MGRCFRLVGNTRAVTAAVGIRSQIDRFLEIVYAQAQRSGYAEMITLGEIVAQSGMPFRLVEKISRYLEREGLLEYGQRAVDLTVEGIMRVESLLAAREAGKEAEQQQSPALT